MNEPLDRLLSAYLDGSLSPARRSAVEKRLSEPRVAKRLAFLRALDASVRAAAPQPSAAQSRRMWMEIQRQVQAGAPAKAEPWYAWVFKPWPKMAFGGTLGLAALYAVIVLLPKHDPIQEAQTLSPAEASAPAPAPEAAKQPETTFAEEAPLAKAAAPAPAPAKKRAAAREELASASAAPEERLTEVERALAEDPIDGLIEEFLRQRPQALAAQPTRAAMAPRQRSLGADAAMAGYAAAPAAMMADDTASPVQAPQGRVDRNGFWDWSAAGLALNQRDWQQAMVELEAAESQAREPSERAFASSALTLLSAAGQPLQGVASALPKSGELRVLAAGVWQLQIDSRLARFSRGVSARLPGFRVEGDALLLDMTFDRGSFSAGTRFTRVSGEAPAKVYNAQAQPVAADSFSAPNGADYHIQDRELHLR